MKLVVQLVYADHDREVAYKQWLSRQGARPANFGAQETWVLVQDGVVTAAMQQAVKAAYRAKLPVRYWALAGDSVHALAHLATDCPPAPADLLAAPDGADRAAATFAEIERRIRSGVPYADLDRQVDALLGTGLRDRDREAEATYEQLAANGRKDG